MRRPCVRGGNLKSYPILNLNFGYDLKVIAIQVVLHHFGIRAVEMTSLPPSVARTQLGVVRCTLTQPEPLNYWRRTAIFQTCTKIDNKNCKVIVDSGSCINTVASKLITTLGMIPVKHPNPYKVTWIDATSIDVQERCQILIQFATYTDNVWCDCLLYTSPSPRDS